MSYSKQMPNQPKVEVGSDKPGIPVREYCDRLKVSKTIFESAKDFYDKVSVSKWYRGQIPAAVAAASIFNACRWEREIELSSLCYRLDVPMDQVVHSLWAVEASSGRARVFRPSPMVTYEPSSYSRSHTYAITDAAGSIEPKTIKLSWTWPERLDFTLEGRYDTKSPHLTETYKRVFREIETASNKAAVQHTQKTMPLVEEKQSLKAVRAPKKLASLIDLVETDATSKKVAVHYPMKTIQLSKDMQSLNIEEPLKKLEPSNDLIDMKAAGKSYAVQHPKQTTQLVEKTQPLKAVKAFKKLEPSKDLVETDAAGKKAAFQHLKKTTQLEEIQPVKAAKPCKELEPVKCMVETSDASKKYAAQYPKKTVPLVEEAQPFKTAKPRNDQEYLKNQVSKEVREVGATIETPHKANVTPNPTEAEASKRRAATKKTQSSQKAKRDEEAEWDIIDSTDDEEKDKDWVEVSGRDLMAEKNEPMGWAGTMKRWFG